MVELEGVLDHKMVSWLLWILNVIVLKFMNGKKARFIILSNYANVNVCLMQQ